MKNDRLFHAAAHRFLAGCAAAFLFILVPSVQAAEVEWRLLGPAASWHADEKGALIERPASVRTDCTVTGSSPLPGGVSIQNVTCSNTMTAERTAWSQFNPAIGLERITRIPGDLVSQRLFGQLVRDSYGQWGAMAGAGLTWQLLSGESFALEAGFAGGLWYRTTAITTQSERQAQVITNNGSSVRYETYIVRETRLQHHLVPFVLPLASITHRPTGLALNVSVFPKTRIAGRLIVPTRTVLVQTSFPL
jgi:hypothetical protein